MQNVKIDFNVKSLPFYAVSHKEGRKTFEIQAFDGIITVSVQYDYKRNPLELTSSIKDGDFVSVIIYGYRIELYINGELKDEEWPIGERFFKIGDTVKVGTKIGEADGKFSSNVYSSISGKVTRLTEFIQPGSVAATAVVIESDDTAFTNCRDKLVLAVDSGRTDRRLG